MKSIRVSEDIVPIGEFKGRAARWMQRAAESRQPVVITQNGRPAAVLLSPAEYDRILERQRFLESVAAGLADAEAGRTLSTEQLREQLVLPARRKTR
jgi:prevent-host-death family protein